MNIAVNVIGYLSKIFLELAYFTKIKGHDCLHIVLRYRVFRNARRSLEGFMCGSENFWDGVLQSLPAGLHFQLDRILPVL